jgi:hypothetical protein
MSTISERKRERPEKLRNRGLLKITTLIGLREEV